MDFNPADAPKDSGPMLLPAGDYTLLVREAEERVSSKGNPMIALELEPVGHQGVLIREYLVATTAAMFKIRNFCECAGLDSQFAAGRIGENDCRGRLVLARVSIEDGTDGYQDKNRVDEFLPGAVQVATAPTAAAANRHAHPAVASGEVTDLDIPF